MHMTFQSGTFVHDGSMYELSPAEAGAPPPGDGDNNSTGQELSPEELKRDLGHPHILAEVKEIAGLGSDPGMSLSLLPNYPTGNA